MQMLEICAKLSGKQGKIINNKIRKKFRENLVGAKFDICFGLLIDLIILRIPKLRSTFYMSLNHFVIAI
jgi:hypothetical protein